jgi:small-conductance mechanosensitive channel
MNALHVHLLLSHAPVVIIVLGAGLLAVGAFLHSEDLKRAALGILVLAALVIVPLYFTGEPSQDAVRALPGISDRILDQHQAVAAPALAGSLLLALLAGAGFFLFRRAKSIAPWFTFVVLAVSLLGTALLVWTANLGGQIRHSEIRPFGSEAK